MNYCFSQNVYQSSYQRLYKLFSNFKMYNFFAQPRTLDVINHPIPFQEFSRCIIREGFHACIFSGRKLLPCIYLTHESKYKLFK